ncbi:MAG TPA: PQQ-binding-like beta-propeller repeat protein, partial [Polyangiaceae bacterium]|nr:PQQ-binding-like beta-propeller repeat protein [Polyangiaceae bacterium]
EGQVYVATHEGYVHALDRTGGFLWSYTVKGAVHVPPVVLPNGAVVVATRHNLIYAIRPNGRRLWVYRVPDPVQTPLAVSDKGTLVFGGGRLYAYAVSALGGLVWRVKLPAQVTEAVHLNKNGTVFMGTRAGVATWQAPTRIQLWESPAVDGFLSGDTSSAREPIWLASGRAFSSHGAMDLGEGIRFGRQLAQGGQLLSTRSELHWIAATGSGVRTVVLTAEPSAAPLLGAQGEVWVPAVDGTLLGVEPNARAARPVARLGFSPVSSLVSDGADQIVAATGEGNVCGVSRTRLGSPP